jgi:hypothetical protein
MGAYGFRSTLGPAMMIGGVAVAKPLVAAGVAAAVVAVLLVARFLRPAGVAR